MSMSFIILPVPIIDIAISVNESALAVGFTILPVALVNRAIGPNLSASALANFWVTVFEPFALVPCAVFKLNQWLFYPNPKFLFELWVVISEASQLLVHRLKNLSKGCLPER